MNGKCPNCGSNVPLPEEKNIGDYVFCPECNTELEIINLNPIELDWPLDAHDDDEVYDDFEEEIEDD